MPLPKADTAVRKLPASLEANIAAEEAQEKQQGLRLQRPEPEKTQQLSLSPIRVSAFQTFEDFYLELRRQDRSLKRYQVMDALLDALAEEEVRRAVIARLQ